ncbi:MAG: zinc ribbon domain-containing protein [Candidatus Anammoximicrobium sp.]|nr:zinc ribbon domain-containing protein [Candidatus Anammoximicrobium sp.]
MQQVCQNQDDTCRKCQRDFELLIRGEETPECPECGSRKLERHLSLAAAHTASGSNPLPVCGTPCTSACGQSGCDVGHGAFD